MANRNRDAGTGKMVSAEDAVARPKETVSEKAEPSLEKRLAKLEALARANGWSGV